MKGLYVDVTLINYSIDELIKVIWSFHQNRGFQFSTKHY